MEFTSVSIILPVMDETDSLVKTVETILRDCRPDVREFIAVICRKTTPESQAVCERLRAANRETPFVVVQQQLPFLGGAVRDAFAHVRGSHVLMMASDLETPPEAVRLFIAEARKNPDALITGSRWMAGGGFEGYDPTKRLLNFVFQRFFSLLYRVRLSDMTYGYRLFPAELVKSIRWEELKHAFLFETLVKPLRLGVRVIEIPTAWKARTEGTSKNTFMNNFLYFRIGLKTLFYSKSRIRQPLQDAATSSGN